MNKVFFIAMLLTLAAAPSQMLAQCTPDTTQTAFLVPDTNTNLETAFTYMPYEQILTVAIPVQDQVYVDPPGLWVPITVDSLILAGFSGLPAWVNYEVFPSGGVFPGGSYACIRFYGTPQMSDIGLYPFTINTVFAGQLFTLDTIVNAPFDGYRITVLDSMYYGVEQLNGSNGFSVFQNAPNPAHSITEITFTSIGNENMVLQIFNMEGGVVIHKEMMSEKGLNSIQLPAANLSPGIYLYRLSNGAQSYTKKMIISAR